MRFHLQILALCLCTYSHFAKAQNESAPPEQAFLDSVTVYTAQGADHNLRELPGAIFGSDIDWESSYFTAVTIGKTSGTFGDRFALLKDGPFKNIEYGYEIVFAKHHGLQDNAELGAAFMMRTPDLNIGPFAVNVGGGVGLSHAFGRPSYEDGSYDNPDKRYKTQLLVLFDSQWKLRKFENISILTRVHHRSGAYGLIAPRNVGSNFLAVGVRYDF